MHGYHYGQITCIHLQTVLKEAFPAFGLGIYFP